MQSAIDRYKLGTEAEVCASDFYGHYIPRRDSRFYCPECGEPVFWRIRGGSQPDKFCHYTKTSSSPECDKRVDGHSGLNLYQRVGLSVYLQCTGEGKYQLGIMFPALSENQIGNAMHGNCPCMAHLFRLRFSLPPQKRPHGIHTDPQSLRYFL